MDKTVSQLIETINCVLNNKIYNENIFDIKKLYSIAQDNGISGILYLALYKNTSIPKEYLVKIYQEFLYYNSKDIKQLKALEEINNLFNQNNIDHIFLKGSYLKTIYPHTFMRSMGDIDILIKEKDLKKVHEVLEQNDFYNYQNTIYHDCFRKDKDIFIEVHPKLNSEFNNKYNQLFTNVWNNTILIKQNEYQFKPEFNLVYLLYHAVKHLNTSGIGLRTVLDIGLFIKKHKDNINIKILNELLNNTHLTLFCKNMIWLNYQYFNFTYLSAIIEDYHPDDDFLSETTNFIVKSGVHGYGKEFNSYICGMTTKGKHFYIIRLLFPKYKTMINIYPYLKKYKFLLPYAWFSRLLRLLFRKTKNSFGKLKRLNIKNEELKYYADLYKKLGI